MFGIINTCLQSNITRCCCKVMECIAALSPISDLIDILFTEERVRASYLRHLISYLCEVLACHEGDAELKV